MSEPGKDLIVFVMCLYSKPWTVFKFILTVLQTHIKQISWFNLIGPMDQTGMQHLTGTRFSMWVKQRKCEFQNVFFFCVRDERSSEEEASDEGETSTGGQHLQCHGHLEQRDPASLGHHVRPRTSVLSKPARVCFCSSVWVCLCRKGTRRVRELWWQGLPPGVRGRVWSLAIGNELNITPGTNPQIPQNALSFETLFSFIPVCWLVAVVQPQDASGRASSVKQLPHLFSEFTRCSSYKREKKGALDPTKGKWEKKTYNNTQKDLKSSLCQTVISLTEP